MMTKLTMAVALVAAGAAGMWFYLRPDAVPSAASGSATLSPAVLPAPPGVAQTLTLSSEALSRAGVIVAAATASNDGAELRVPGVVEPDAYRTVDVTPIVGGTVVSVAAALGDSVREGAVVARLRSPELTDEVRQWMTGRANLDAVSRRLARTRQLAKIGAASQQELETDQSDFVRASTDVETARARLLRLGLDDPRLAAIASGDTIPELIDIKASASGIVIRRAANQGQNVGPADSLITLANLARVWVMADVFERDLGRVRVGQSAVVSVEAFTGRTWTGRLTYLDAELARESRTARARVEVDNPDGVLRFGMFVALTLKSTSEGERVMVPATAVQTIGAVPVVYVQAQHQDQFQERPVVVGAGAGDRLEIRSGLKAGERVVVSGSFLLRAERDRLGWPPPTPPLEVAAGRVLARPASPSSAGSPVPVTRHVIEITAAGLTPVRVTVPANQAVDLVFVRRIDDSCGEDVVIPALGIRRKLPRNEEVVIRLPAQPPGELTFSCGLDMLRGVIVVSGGGAA
jgi:cobalt-zinc-cadmium efflux system membrane fusion protein